MKERQLLPRLGRPRDGGNRGRQHDRGGVIGQEHGHDRANREDQAEQSCGRPVCQDGGARGQPVEQALLPRKLRQQHHAGQEQIDVPPLATPARLPRRQQAEQDQECRAADGPNELGPGKRARDDASSDQPGDAPSAPGRGEKGADHEIRLPRLGPVALSGAPGRDPAASGEPDPQTHRPSHRRSETRDDGR